MDLQNKLHIVSEKMHDLIRVCDPLEYIPTEGVDWENFRYTGPQFRQAHIERYNHDGLIVLHVVILPHADDWCPIYGFDIVGSQKTNKVSGAFLDWSPTFVEREWHNTVWEKDRELPVWAKVFSKQFIAIRPTEDEIDPLIDFAFESFTKYMKLVGSTKVLSQTTVDNIVRKQNEYCEYQASNPRTRAALTQQIGAEAAREFMENVLFPKIEV